MEPKVCPICKHPRVVNLSDHLIRSQNISGKEKKTLLRRARFMSISCKNGHKNPNLVFVKFLIRLLNIL